MYFEKYSQVILAHVALWNSGKETHWFLPWHTFISSGNASLQRKSSLGFVFSSPQALCLKGCYIGLGRFFGSRLNTVTESRASKGLKLHSHFHLSGYTLFLRPPFEVTMPRIRGSQLQDNVLFIFSLQHSLVRPCYISVRRAKHRIWALTLHLNKSPLPNFKYVRLNKEGI